MSAKPGMFDEVFSMIGRKLREMTENVIETATTAVNNTVRDTVPKLVDAAKERLTPDRDGRFTTAGIYTG